ncbi:unnamed protein product [Paramecium pentaurelia]|uniref:Uncharacterized protein n=1 Tax=Paramecium pentaurelia TaxID=43138 RepID=A0A8S1T2C7_9CILI|nr:unnamed protein product [Paramecium pentaurelia]
MNQLQNEHVTTNQCHFKLVNTLQLGKQDINYLNYNIKYSTLLVGIGRRICVFQFNNFQLKLIGSFFNNREHFSIIYSMQKQKVIITGDSTGMLKVYQLSNINQNRYLYQLKGHDGCISHIAMNSQENDLITSSVNSTIKFWNQKNIWICYQTLIQHQDLLLGFSLNESGNQLISYGFDDYILVTTKVKNKQFWQVIQKISNKLFSGGRLSYISDNSFFFQAGQKDFMIIYNKTANIRLYQQTSQINLKMSSSSLDCLSKLQFARQNLVLLTKLDKTINCLKFNESGNIIFQEYIDIQANKFVVCISEDANYLFTANNESNQLQIRKNFRI